MLVLGLTGSIAMGKSTTADMLRRLGVPAHDADGCVHRLFARGGSAVGPVARAFPGVAADGAVDRARLGAAAFGRPEALARLEAIVHPLVRADRDRFLAARRRARARVVALDVPLLFESGGEKACDAAIVVTAPRFLQRRRALARPGMTEAKLDAILARQTPDAEKRRRADVVIPTGAGRALAFRRLKRYLLRKRRRAAARGRARCAKSCWTPKRPASKSRPGTGSSRSGRWSFLNHIPTGESFHRYIDPERDVEQGAFDVHGLDRAFLAEHRPFRDVAGDFLAFAGDARLVIHNAPFDMGFLDMELERAGLPRIPLERVVDTLAMARRRFPGAPASLDALCARFGIDNSHRDTHGALVDARLLASVYLELAGGRQPGFELAREAGSGADPAGPAAGAARPPREFAPSAGERAAHEALLDRIEDPIWRRE